MPNTNCLEGIKCPKCGFEYRFNKVDESATEAAWHSGTLSSSQEQL